jgi:hypothetical protein
MQLLFITVLFIPSASGFSVRTHDYKGRKTFAERFTERFSLAERGEPDMELPPENLINPTNGAKGKVLATAKQRLWATVALGFLVAAPPATLFTLGVVRRATLEKMDDERGKRVRKFARPYVKAGKTGDLWPSEYNGALKGQVPSHDFLNISDEGCMCSYSATRVTTLFGTFADRDGVFFSYNLNIRLMTQVAIGMTVAIVSQIIWNDVAEATKNAEGKQEKWEMDHIFEQLESVSGVLAPALSLFLSFYVSYMISRGGEYASSAVGGMWAAIVNFNIILAAELPDPKHDRLRKTACRYSLAIWEDMFDSIRMDGDDYGKGYSIDELEDRGLLLGDEATHIKNAVGGRSTHAQPLCAWLMALVHELAARKEISEGTHKTLQEHITGIRGGVAYSTGLPVLQYPYLAIQFLNVIVNGVTTMDAIKQGLEIGGSIQLMRNASWTMFNSETLPPALCLILTPLFFYGSLELGAKLDNPMHPGYIIGRNIHGVPRHAWHQAIRDNIENYNHMAEFSKVEGSSFAKCFD